MFCIKDFDIFLMHFCAGRVLEHLEVYDASLHFQMLCGNFMVKIDIQHSAAKGL